MRKTFIDTLIAEAETNPDIWLLTADFGFGVLEPFKRKFPDRFLNTGIAEQNTVGIAAGLALSGKIPYVYTAIPFVSARPFEQIKVDCAYMNTNVKLIGVGAGFSYGPGGATHHSIEDIAIMRSLPNMSVLAPGSLNETKALVKDSAKRKGPEYIRLGRSGEPDLNYSVQFGKFSTLKEGKDVAVISTSTMLADCIAATDALEKKGVKACLFSAHTLKPFDEEGVLNLLKTNTPIVSVEEHNIIGGLADCISAVIAKSGMPCRFLPLAVADKFSHYIGSQKFIKQKMGLGNLSEKIESFL